MLKLMIGVVIGLILGCIGTSFAVGGWEDGKQLLNHNDEFQNGYVAGRPMPSRRSWTRNRAWGTSRAR